MWVYIPKEYCPSLPESVDSTCQSNSPSHDPELWLTLSGKPTARKSSWIGCRTRPWMTDLFGQILPHSMASSGVAKWIRSLGASPVRTFQSQERKQESMKGQDRDSTTTTSDSFTKYDPDSSLWRTYQACWITGQWELYSENFPKWGSMRNGECSQRQEWVAPINGRESSSWPTPNASRSGAMKGDNPRGKHAGNPLKTASESWPTPKAVEIDESIEQHEKRRLKPNAKKRGASLTVVSKSWPTPRKNDFKGHCTEATTRKDGKCRNDQLVNAVIHTGPLGQTKQTSGGKSSTTPPISPQQLRRLNPTFVEWLMGMPTGWSLPTPIDQSAYRLWVTESSRLLVLLLSPCYSRG